MSDFGFGPFIIDRVPDIFDPDIPDPGDLDINRAASTGNLVRTAGINALPQAGPLSAAGAKQGPTVEELLCQRKPELTLREVAEELRVLTTASDPNGYVAAILDALSPADATTIRDAVCEGLAKNWYIDYSCSIIDPSIVKTVHAKSYKDRAGKKMVIQFYV